MVGARHITATERDAFLAGLAELSQRHRIVVDVCCCRIEEEHSGCSHFALSRLDDQEVFLGYKQDGVSSDTPSAVVEQLIADVVPPLPKPKPEVPTW